jgi:hypothetical protein
MAKKYGTFYILRNGDMSEFNLISDTVDLRGLDTYKIIATWANGSGTPVGQLLLEASTDYRTYETILESEQTIADDVGFHIWDFPYNPVALIRAKYIRSTGSGTMQIFIQVGGADERNV